MRGDTTFEVQTYQRGAWKVASIHDDRQIALFEATRMYESGRYAGVRVVLDQFDEATGTFTQRTVFRTSKADDVNNEVMERQKKLRREISLARQTKGCSESKTSTSFGSAQSWQPGPVALTLLLAAIILGGIAAIIALRNYFGGI